MATVNEILVDALEDLVVQADEAPIEASEARTAIRALNLIMAKLAAKGIEIGWSNVSKVSDVVTIPDGAVDSVVSLLAYRLAPKYISGEVSGLVLSNAQDAIAVLAHIGRKPINSSLPSTLPIGSGNYWSYGESAFYPDSPDSILSEINGAISLEDNTEAAS